VALDAPDCLQVIAIMNMGFGSRKNHRLVKGESHAVTRKQYAAAGPVVGDDFVFRTHHLIDVSDDHDTPPATFSTRGRRPATARTSAVARSTISSPCSSCSPGMVSAGSTLRTSSWAPEVSITTPSSKA